MAYAEQFSAMRTREAIAACVPMPLRLLLYRESGTAARRAGAAQGKLWVHVPIGAMLAILLACAIRASGAGDGTALVAALAVLVAWPLYFYRRYVRDATQLFELEVWIDFEQRVWHSCKSYADANMPQVVERVPLDALMLLCTASIGQGSWCYDIFLCKCAEFDPAAKSWPDWIESVLSTDTEQSATECAVTIANLWKIPCWRFSGAFDEKSQHLNG